MTTIIAKAKLARTCAHPGGLIVRFLRCERLSNIQKFVSIHEIALSSSIMIMVAGKTAAIYTQPSDSPFADWSLSDMVWFNAGSASS